MSILDKCSEQISVLEKLNAWSEEPTNKDVMGAHAASVSNKIRSSLFLANNVRSAASYKPTVGVYGPSQAGKSYLTAKFAENEQGVLKVKLGSEFDFLQAINPAGGRESTALVSRFTTDVLHVDDAFPITANTLSEIDIICILANSYCCDNSHPEYPELDDIERVLDVYNFDGNSFDFLRDSDAYRLEHYLVQKVLPRDISERFASLWSKAAAVKQAASISERAEVYSLLWNGNEQFTNLFVRFAEALSKIGGDQQIYLPISSLMPRENSIIDVSILEDLDSDGSAAEIIKTKSKEVSLEKAVLSALISELYLPIIDPKRSVFEKADLLDFPGARTRFQKRLQDNNENGVHEFFLRGKIDYLFHKFTMDLRLDALVFCVDPGPLNVRELPDSLNDWLQLNCHDQLSFDNNLFFTLTKFDTHFPDAAGNQKDVSQRFENALDSGLIQPFAREGTSWPVNWNGHPFTNVFPVRNPNYPLHGYFEYDGGMEVAKSERMENRLVELKDGYLGSNLVSAHVADAEAKWDDLTRVNGGGVEFLANQIDVLNLGDLKTKNLNGTLDAMAKSIADMLSMFVQSENGDERLQLEKDKFKELLKPIYAIGQNNKFAALLKSVGVNEQLIKASIHSAILEDSKETAVSPKAVDLDGWQPDIFSEDNNDDVGNNSDLSSEQRGAINLADRILRTWLHSLSGTAPATKIANELNTTADSYEFLVSHLAHEVQIEKLRLRISSRLQSLTYGMTLDANIGAAAKISSDEINSHLCMKPAAELEEVVENASVDTFSVTNPTDPITRWQSWLNTFTEVISENCKVQGPNGFDANQNAVLLANLQKLTPA